MSGKHVSVDFYCAILITPLCARHKEMGTNSLAAAIKFNYI